MRALKALVVGMGVLIVLGLGLVVWGFLRQAEKLETRRAGEGAAAVGFTEAAVPAPAGCEIAEASTDGGALLLRLAGPRARGCQQVVIVDLASGAVRARVRLDGP